MARGLIVVLAFVATAAQAQVPTKAAEATASAALPDGKMVASWSVPEPTTSPLSPTTGQADTAAKYAQCPAVVTMLAGDVPAIRTYEPPRLPPAGQSKTPQVQAVVRYGSLYIFQIWNRSKDPWVVETARLEGPNGVTLKVNGVLNNPGKGTGWGINIIVAEAPPGTTFPSLKIYLTAKDGRSAQLKVGDLP